MRMLRSDKYQQQTDQQSTASASVTPSTSAAMQNQTQSYKSNQTTTTTTSLTPKKSSMQTRNLLDPAQFMIPASSSKQVADEDEEIKDGHVAIGQKGVTTVTTGNTTHITSVVEPPDRRRKNIVVNTIHCRNEVDTVQYVVSKFGYRETR